MTKTALTAAVATVIAGVCLTSVGRADDRPGGGARGAPATQPATRAAAVNVLYVDGYPRWEYRYVRNEMIRDKSVNIACLLTSADRGVAQDGDAPAERFPGPLKVFPETLEQIRRFDVLVIGDVDPRTFTLAQLELVVRFVEDGGGLVMVAGPRHAPTAYKDGPLAKVLPVELTRAEPGDAAAAGADQAFVPVITDAGRKREFVRRTLVAAKPGERTQPEKHPLYWYARGLAPAKGATVLAAHPKDKGPDDKPAAILVEGRAGRGRTLFVGVDDTWRWRFQSGTPTFESYWSLLLHELATPAAD